MCGCEALSESTLSILIELEVGCAQRMQQPSLGSIVDQFTSGFASARKSASANKACDMKPSFANPQSPSSANHSFTNPDKMLSTLISTRDHINLTSFSLLELDAKVANETKKRSEVTSTLTAYLTPNTCLSTPRLRYNIPKINNPSAKQLGRATLLLLYKKALLPLASQSMLPHTHNRLATCALANSTKAERDHKQNSQPC